MSLTLGTSTHLLLRGLRGSNVACGGGGGGGERRWRLFDVAAPQDRDHTTL